MSCRAGLPLRADVESALKNADVSSHHKPASHRWIDVTTTDMAESLEGKGKVNILLKC